MHIACDRSQMRYTVQQSLSAMSHDIATIENVGVIRHCGAPALSRRHTASAPSYEARATSCQNTIAK